MSQGIGYIALFDKNWQALGNWTNHICREWSLTRKAYESDEFSATCQGWENSANACYVGLFTPSGSLKYVAFAGIPTSTKEGFTTINAIDCRSVFNQQLVVDYTKQTAGSYVVTSPRTLFEYLMQTVFSDNSVELGITYSINVTDLDFLESAWNENYIVRSKEVRNVYEELQAACMLYNIYIEVSATVTANNAYQLVFTAKRIINSRPIKLADYDVHMKRTYGTPNRAIYGTLDGSKGYLYLNNDNSITTSYNSSKAVFPLVTISTIGDDAAESLTQAYKTLSENRFKDRVTIDLNSKLGSTLSDMDFSYYGVLVGYNPADQSSSKELPVSAIKEDSRGNKSIQFGRLSEYWFMD